MKKIKVLVMFFFITASIFARDDIVFNFNLGDVGFGGNFPLVDDHNFEFNVSLLNFGIENRRTNFGIEFTPIKAFFWSSSGEGESENGGISLTNLKLYWNVINFAPSINNFFMGPFASINYLFVDEFFHWNRFVFTTGLRAGFRLNLRRTNYNFFTAEMGYRNINGMSRYFIGARIDIGALLLIAAVAWLADNSEPVNSQW